MGTATLEKLENEVDETDDSNLLARGFSVEVKGVVNGDWNEYLASQYEAWDAATKLANGLYYELLIRDVPPWKKDVKPLKLVSCADAFGESVSSLAYRLASGAEKTGLEQFANMLPSGTVASLARKVAADYASRRRGFMLQLNDRLPLLSFPFHYTVRGNEVELGIDPTDEDAFTVSLPYLRVSRGVVKRVTLLLAKNKNDRYTTGKIDKISGVREMPILEKMRRGIITMGSITVNHDRKRVSSSDSKKLPIRRDKFGQRYAYLPKIGFSYYVKPAEPISKNTRNFSFVHTDSEHFVTVHPWSGKPWNLCQDHIRNNYNMLSPEQMRALTLEHDRLLLRLKQDTKQRDFSSRQRSATASERQINRFSTFIKNIACVIVNKVQTYHRTIYYLNADERYMPHFPWFMLEQQLRNLCEERGMTFVPLESYSTKWEEDANGIKFIDYVQFMQRLKQGEVTLRIKKTKQERITDATYRKVQKLEEGLGE